MTPRAIISGCARSAAAFAFEDTATIMSGINTREVKSGGIAVRPDKFIVRSASLRLQALT
ncbi:MAG TPA: hypothetical protein VFA51_02320 [Candidatus Udaeobacter sp.]|nr:hypothetical protein [Candidatus Udaeobacter sp.]